MGDDSGDGSRGPRADADTPIGCVGRIALERAEEERLAPGAARSRGAPRREEEPEDELRTRFQRDRDRVIHSSAFRRLQHKTQVVAAYESDHVRTRLAHSLEVSQMARSVARALRHNEDLCEANALAHDLGHPPFGHVGERALDALMQQHGGFRHNAHGLRIVDRLEDRRGDGLGLNLTRPTRVSLLKGRVPDGFPVSDDFLAQVRAGALEGVPREARIVDLCDRIAYLCHDVDDGLRVGVFHLADLEELSLWQLARAQASDDTPARVLSQMVSLMIHDLVHATDEDAVRHSDEVTVGAEALLRFLRERFYRSRRVMDVMDTGERMITAVFEHFLEHPEHMSDGARARLERAESLERGVCDYVAGMTDRFLAGRAESIGF